MKMKTLKIKRTLAALLLATVMGGTLLLSACSGGMGKTEEAAYDAADADPMYDDPDAGMPYDKYEATESEVEAKELGEMPAAEEVSVDTDGPRASGANVSQMSQTTRLNETLKIIRTANIAVWCENIEDAYRRVERKGIDLGGYVADAMYSGDEFNRQHSVTFRIPAENFDAFMDAARDLGEVEQENISSEDVTDSYYDSKTRLATKRIQLARLESLLEKAEKLEDILRLEKEINQVTEEIEGFEGKLKRYDKLVAYSTITIDLLQIYDKQENMQQEEKPSFSTRIKEAATDTAEFAVAAAQGTVIFLLRALPALIVLAIVALILRWAYRRQQKKAKDNAISTVVPWMRPSDLPSASEKNEDEKK